MYHYVLTLCLITIAIRSSSPQTIDFNLKNNKTFRFYTFMAPCAERLKEAYIDSVRVHRLRDGRYTLDYDVHLGVDLDDFRADVRFSRCAAREALDTCVAMPPLATNRGCQFMTAPNVAWTPLVKCATPQMRCPIKKAHYRYRNCSLDLTLYNFMPLGRYYWRAQIVMSAHGRRLCFKCEGSVIN